MGTENNKREGVFISYSHDSPEHADRVLSLANRLLNDGIDCTIDQYETAPPEGWPKWMVDNVENSRFVLVICTQLYLDRSKSDVEPGTGKGVKWESLLTYNMIYHAGSRNERFIPVIFSWDDEDFIPLPLKGCAYYSLDTDKGYDALYRRLSDQPPVKKPSMGKKKIMPTTETAPMDFPSEAEAVKTAEMEVDVSISRLPVTGEFLLGREKELDFLDRAWAEGASVVTVVAMGGVGKSALVNRWLQGVQKDNYRGARRVWAWSFYSQGSGEGRQVSADTFIDAALREFGDPDPVAGSPWDRGVRLAKLVRRQKTLLLLDGLEPMQFPPGQQYGRLKDQPLQALLRELAFDNPGLCVVTTRVKVTDLSDKTGPGDDKPVWLLNLDQLAPAVGAELLLKRGVKGPEQELQEVSKHVGGHALALNLLGTYLAEVHAGDVRCVGEVELLSEDVDETGHAERVMAKYEEYLSGTPELEILYLLGFFDHPADAGAIAALMAKRGIKKVTRKLRKLPVAKWKKALIRLQSLGLVSKPQEAQPTAQESSPPILSLDTHPLVREYFSRRLKAKRPKAYTTGHRRLYEYYKGLPEGEQPDTLREMEPLYIAINHGCEAGLYQETFTDVYRKRITRGGEYYSTKKLGAFGSDLAALSSFFREPWKRPVDGLSEWNMALVLNLSGVRLLVLGRLREAVQALEVALGEYTRQGHWTEAALNARNLSQLWLCLGDVGKAVDLGRKSVVLADRSGAGLEMLVERTTLADALHQAGDRDRAEGLFRDAEARQKKMQTQYLYLFSLQGFQYCDLLLARARSGEVRKRVKRTLEWVTQHNLLMAIALDKLSLGLAHWQESPSPGGTSAQTARQYLDRAVEGLREAGTLDRLPLGLLSRAGFLCWAGQIQEARRDLREAWEIAERGEMKLYLTDFHLESCRLELDEKNMEKAKEHFEKAKQLVEETGYHRRDGEVRELEGKM